MISEHLHFNFELPKLPEGLRIYAIGDVHGRADLLNQLFARIDAHLEILFCGQSKFISVTISIVDRHRGRCLIA
jgi:hypothetical protein